MGTPREELLRGLSDAVVEMNGEKAAELSRSILEQGIDPHEAMEKGLCRGMERVRRLFEDKEYRIPELLACTDAMQAGLDVLEPKLRCELRAPKRRLIGTATVFGDASDVGKTVTKILVESMGFQAIDLGSNLRAEEVLEAAVEAGARVVVLSASSMNAIGEFRRVGELLTEARRKNGLRVVVGGIPISREVAAGMGADGYASDAAEMASVAVRLAREDNAPRGAAAVCCGPTNVLR